MTPELVLLIVAVVIVAAGAIANNFFHKQYAADIAELKTTLANKLPAAVDKTVGLPAPVAASQPVNVTIHPVTITVGGGTPGQLPAGTITNAPTPETFNGVEVPAGMTLASFTALGLAKQGVMAFLASASVVASIVTESDAWFASLGAYFVEQLSAQAPAGSPLAARIATYVAAHPVEVVSAAQEAAAVQAVANVAPAKA